MCALEESTQRRVGQSPSDEQGVNDDSDAMYSFTEAPSYCVSSSPLVSAAVSAQMEYLCHQLPATAKSARDDVADARRQANKLAFSILWSRIAATGLSIQGRNLQQDRLTSEDLLYAVGTFLVTFSFSVGRLFTIRNPNLECRASDAFQILDEFSYLKSECVVRELPASVRNYEASKFGFRIRKALGCILGESGAGPRRLSLVTNAVVAGMQRTSAIGRYGL